jgi:hypothetical protein
MTEPFYSIEPLGTFSVYKVVPKVGRLPDSLSGHYTSRTEAQKAITRLVEAKAAAAIKNTSKTKQVSKARQNGSSKSK